MFKMGRSPYPLGKLTDSSTTKYKLNINGIISGLSSKRVKMIRLEYK